MMQAEAGRHHIQQAICEVDHLGKVVNDFTQWSLFDINAGNLNEVHAIRLTQICEEVVRRLQAVHKDRVLFDAEGAATVFASRTHVEQALINLMTNALQYSPPDSPVEVAVKGTLFSIRDHGKGIPEKVLANLGTPFNVGEHSGAHRGTGLGLAWVCAIAQKYRWSFQIEKWEEGSIVHLDLEPRAVEL